MRKILVRGILATNRVVARASRPCGLELTGETPVPLLLHPPTPTTAQGFNARIFRRNLPPVEAERMQHAPQTLTFSAKAAQMRWLQAVLPLPKANGCRTVSALSGSIPSAEMGSAHRPVDCTLT